MLKSAIILAGGFGTRLQGVVKHLPKPMAPVNHRPFLDYQFDYLKHFGIKNLCLSVGYLSEKISEHYQNNYKGLSLIYAVEEEPLGTGGGIRMAMDLVKDEQILVLNGDSFFDIDLLEFYDKHRAGSAAGSLALRMVMDASRYGEIELGTGNGIKAFHEKNTKRKAGLINAGVYLLNRTYFLMHTPAGENFSIEKDFFSKEETQERLKAYAFEGYFIDIGVPEDYKQAQDDFKRFAYK